VDLPVFPAGVAARRKGRDEFPGPPPAGKAGGQYPEIDAADDGCQAGGEHLFREFRRGPAPEREQGFHPRPRQHLFPVRPQIRQENVPKGDATDPLRPGRGDKAPQGGFVFLVGTDVGKPDRPEGQPRRCGLPRQELPAGVVHENPVMIGVYRRQEPGDLHVRVPAQQVEDPGAVLAAAPTDEDLFLFHQI